MRRKLVWLAAAAAIIPVSTLAQERPAPAARPQPRPPEKSVEEVTVTGQRNETRIEADRRSYSVATDLQSTSGNIGDALRNIPSVDVDVQGNVSLRGDSNVTIMIDGKPSAMFQGQGRADALQRIPADQIERVEVMTNPSASFSPEGTAGVINLVTKKAKGVGASGTVKANYGDRGRYQMSVSGGYNSKTLSLAGDLGYRHEKPRGRGTDVRRRIDPGTGAEFESSQRADFFAVGDFWNGGLKADWDPDDKNRFSGGITFFNQDLDQQSFDRFEGESPFGTVGFDRLGTITSDFNQKEATAAWRRKFSGEAHELAVDASYERGIFHGHRRYRTIDAVPGDLFEITRDRFTQRQAELKVDYKRPMPDAAKLNLGYALQYDDNDYDNRAFRGGSFETVAPDPQFTNHFLFEQQIHAAYATYERPMGDVTAKVGVRVEQAILDLTQRTIGRSDRNDYLKVYPSVHMAWRVNERQQLTVAFSQRIQRPSPQDLNPFRFFLDALNFREGNPDLEPAETRSYEAAYQYRSGLTLYLATLFYRDRENEITDVVEDLGGGLLLTRRENLGKSRNGGIELVANGRLTSKLAYNASATALWTEIEARNLGFPEPRSGASLSGRANLNWQVTPRDFIQFNAMLNGRRLIPQGYQEATGMLNIGYRHSFNDRLSFQLMAQDVLDTFHFVVDLDTPTLEQRREQRNPGPSVMVGLTYVLGGQGARRRQPESFDFGGGGGAPP